MLNTLLRRLAVTHHARALDAFEVHATDVPRALSGRRDAARVLLVGSGVTSGWGVQTHGLALVGSLRRELQVRLGRPVDVEQVSTLGASLTAASAVIGEHAAEEWDAIVVAFGLSDAMCLTPVQDWARDLGHLLARLDADMPRGLLIPIAIVGVPPMNELGALRLVMPLRSFIARHGERLNAATRTMVARNRRAVFVPLPGMANSSERPTGSPEAYRAWATAISDALHPMIAAGITRVDVDAIGPVSRRDLAAAVLAPRNAGVRAALRDTVEQMAARYSADLVLLNVVRGDTLWVVARSAGAAVESMARAATLSDETLRVGLLHVEDVGAHPRFSMLEGALGRGVASYAGLAVRDGLGVGVGTLSIINGSTSGPIDPVVLREYGSTVEGLLALLERGPTDEVEDPSLLLSEPADPLPNPEPSSPTSGQDERPGPTPQPTAVRRRLTGPLGRHRRLQREGRLLTDVAAVRSVPAETDLWVPGADPVRVLVVGGEYSVGFGATTRAEALDGALARLLHTRTGRGVLVENRAQHQVRLHQLAASLGPAGAATFDLVVWTPTFIEGARLLFRSRWLAGIELMLRRIESTSTASVVLVGYPSLLGSQPLAVLGRARAAQVNRLLRRIALRHDRVRVAEPPAITLKHVESSDGPQVYREAAVRIFPTAIDLVEANRRERRSAPVAGADRPDAEVQRLVDA